MLSNTLANQGSATEPPDPRRVSEGFLKGSLLRSLKGF